MYKYEIGWIETLENTKKIENTHPIESACALTKRLNFGGKYEMGLNEKQDARVLRWKEVKDGEVL